jgi:hypothetical protein
MYPVSGEQDDFKVLAERFTLHYVNTSQDRLDLAALRGAESIKNSQVKKLEDCEAGAHHLLLRNQDSGKAVASVYVLGTPFGSDQSPILHGKPLPILIGRARAQGEPGNVSEMSVPVLSSVISLQDWAPKDSWQVGLYLSLASHALARLLFHDYLLAELPIESFKKYRMRGLSFEYACDLPEAKEHSALFYIDLNVELKPSCPLYTMSQHVSNVIAPQLNMPELQEKEA